MNAVKYMLIAADPVRLEGTGFERRRDVMRRSLLIATTETTVSSLEWPRPRTVRAALVAAAMVLSVAVLVFWTRGLPTLLAAPVRFEMRLVEDQPAPGLREAQVGVSGRTIYLHEDVIVDNDDVADARVVPGDASARFNIRVMFTAAGAAKMRAATAGRVGGRIAILLDDEVVMAATIRAEIDDIALITGRYSEAEARRLAEGITRSIPAVGR